MATEDATFPTSKPPALAWSSGQSLRTVEHLENHKRDRNELRAMMDECGLAPGAADNLGFVRIGDDDGHGLWVPIAAVAGPSLIVNGNMDHFQGVGGSGTQTSTTTYNTTTSYAADQMYVVPAGASVTQQRSTSVPDSKSEFSLQVNGASSVTTVDIGQRIEAASVKRHGKQMQLFQAQVYNDSGAAFTPNLRVGTPSSADDFTTVTNRLDQPLQECADSAWTWVYFLFDPSGYTNIDNGLDVALRVPSGSLVASDTVRVAQFDCRPGTHLVPFQPAHKDLQKPLCMRYFERLASWGTSAAFGFGVAAGASDVRFTVPYFQKRTNPTLTFSDNSDLQALNNAFSAADSGTLSTATAGPFIAQCRMNSIGGSVTLSTGDAVLVRWTDTDGYIDVKARL